MENEEAFQADAELDGREHIHLRSSHRSSQKGHDTVKAALGDLEADSDIVHEESPLLPSIRADGGGEAFEHGASEPREPPKWEGQGDFEGRPWWKKPSVRNP